MEQTHLEKAVEMIKDGSDLLYTEVEAFLESQFDTKIDYIMFEFEPKKYDVFVVLGLADGTTETVELRAYDDRTVSAIYNLPKFLRGVRRSLKETNPSDHEDEYKQLKRDVQKALIRELRSIWNDLKGRRTYRQAYARFQNRSKALDFVTGKWVDVDTLASENSD